MLKKVRPTDRPMTTPLFLLRCVQLGISIRDRDLLTIGLVNECMLKTATMITKDIRKYLVLYIPDDDTQVVTIIRVMYGGRDVDTQLNRFTKTK